ncbi:hypothetical protein [Aneurinibacillus tyrosinisolvens]|uniref:hypothetical protein n=1 Tax=Aneurinibacillus tyrosinisolvens TaxID=1443435 RepID=UPI00063F8BDF|nr:hypothetical protein [Aneurinibacillus tyrosinisolvens]
MTTNNQNENIVGLFFGESNTPDKDTSSINTAATVVSEGTGSLEKAKTELLGQLFAVASKLDESISERFEWIANKFEESAPRLLDGSETVDALANELLQAIKWYVASVPGDHAGLVIGVGNDIVNALLTASTTTEEPYSKVFADLGSKLSHLIADYVDGLSSQAPFDVETEPVVEQLAPSQEETQPEEKKEEDTQAVDEAEAVNEGKEEPEKEEIQSESSGQMALFDFGAAFSAPPKKKKNDGKNATVTATPSGSKPPEIPATSANPSSKSSGKQTTTSSQTGVKASNNHVKAKKDQNISVEGDWTIHYAAQFFRVSDVVNPMPASGKTSLEEIRAAMEREFFEMTKERVKWDYDTAKKRLFPDVSGASKGGC